MCIKEATIYVCGCPKKMRTEECQDYINAFNGKASYGCMERYTKTILGAACARCIPRNPVPEWPNKVPDWVNQPPFVATSSEPTFSVNSDHALQQGMRQQSLHQQGLRQLPSPNPPAHQPQAPFELTQAEVNRVLDNLAAMETTEQLPQQSEYLQQPLISSPGPQSPLAAPTPFIRSPSQQSPLVGLTPFIRSPSQQSPLVALTPFIASPGQQSPPAAPTRSYCQSLSSTTPSNTDYEAEESADGEGGSGYDS